ncbi:glycosyltransferase family 2 protein [Acinetobacter sp. YH12142]|uniref:glycosyltransferase family 2 protein n=1 Tax=Acinetobacter sp. YH12142 TaxID=2601126 RepID=UPI0015D0F884|nr:glycosyltransferase family 2 protein [Acinetobacter sp. YH12142]
MPMPLTKKQEQLDLTVVVPFYNRSNYAERLIDSVLHQSSQPKNFWFIDNGSNQNEVEKLKKIINARTSENLSIEYLKTEKSGNANYARNLGLVKANTKYVAFLDSDDWWESCHLEESVRVLDISGKAAVYGGAIIHYGNSTVVNYSGDIALVDTPFHVLFSSKGWSAQTSSYVVNKTKIGNLSWDENLKRHQDYDFFLALEYLTTGWIFNSTPSSNLERDDAVSGRNFDIKSMINFLEKWKNKFPKECLEVYLINQMDLCIIAKLDKKYYEYYRNIYIDTKGNKYIFKLNYKYRNFRRTSISILKKLKLFSFIKKLRIS